MTSVTNGCVTLFRLARMYLNVSYALTGKGKDAPSFCTTVIYRTQYLIFFDLLDNSSKVQTLLLD